MKLKKSALMMAGVMALAISFNVNAMSPAISTRIAQEGSTRTTPCLNHEWEYVIKTLGDITYYNYRCEVCSKYKYSPWLKE